MGENVIEISKQQFQEWATGLSGCEGGNIDKAHVWVCGIEPGGGNSTRESLEKNIAQGIRYNQNYKWNQHQYTYGKSLAKLYTAIFDATCKNAEDLKQYSKYIQSLNDNEVFRLNLYPIAFTDTSPEYWSKNKLNEVTGFDSKHLYQLWCFFNRFPEFLKLRQKRNPELIICTGIHYLKDFLACFAGNKNIDIQVGKIKGREGSNNTYERTYYHVKVDKTLIVVIPFFSGSYGLNSHYLLNEMGKIIREKLDSCK